MNYIRDARALGFNDEQIKVSLTQVGWDEDHVIKAQEEITKSHTEPTTKVGQEKEEIKTPTGNKMIFPVLVTILIFALFVAGYGIYRNFLVK